MIDPSHPPRLPAALRVVLLITGVVLTVAALKLARPVLVPLVGGAFVGVLAQPLLRRLSGALPSWLALTLTMLAVLAVLAAFLGALTWSARDVTEALAERRDALEATIDQLRQRAARLGLARGSRGGGGGAGGTSDVARPVIATLASAGGGLLIALAVAALGLAERDALRARLLRALSRGRGAATLDAIGEIAQAFRRYVWVKSLTSAITGVASGLLALAFGLPLAWVWGFLAFLLEFVPTIGSLLAIVPPTAMGLADAAASGGGLGRAGAVFVAFGALQVVLGNVVDPRIEGKLMTLSPLGVLVSIVVWGWVWGAAGALLAVPLTVAIVLVCRRIPAARGVATLLAGDGTDEDADDRPAPDARVARAGGARH